MLFTKENKFLLYIYLGIATIALFPLLSTNKVDLHLAYSIPHSKFKDFFFLFMTLLGDGRIVAILIFLSFFYRVNLGLSLTSSATLSGLLVQFLKHHIYEDVYRPWFYLKNSNALEILDNINMHEKFSFPSGHTTTAFAVFFLCALYFKSKPIKYIFFILAIIIGYSRVYLSQHFFIDIYGGSIIGVIFSTLSLFAFSNVKGINKPLLKILKKNKNETVI